MIWWIFPAAVGFFGLMVLLTGLARFGKLKLFSGTVRSLGGGLFIAGAALLSLIGLNLQTYSRLTHERSVATVDLVYVEPQHFTAIVRLEGSEQPLEYDILGDEIEFQARIIKWKPWANVIGYDAIYRLDRLKGQYRSITEDREKPRSVFPLRSETGMDAFELIQKRGGWLQAVDAHYGSGTYVPMTNGASYEVIMTQNGLITRPSNDQARDVLREWMRPDQPYRDDGT